MENKSKTATKEISIGEVSDGYHTFNELYEFRRLYNAALVKSLKATGIRCEKSVKHSDGELCFGGGWFIVNIILPTGMVSNHYNVSDWDLFDCETVEIPTAYDGHTVDDVKQRLKDFSLTKG